jgi:magnesium-protoporphyrin IX monomethyl ester (oxidative) cyclase
MYQSTLDAPAKVNESTKAAQEDAVLNPRFYTTDFAAMDKVDVGLMRKQWDELIDEFRSDPNKDHFKRNAEFDADFSHYSPELKREFVDFLVSSVTAEFSGCILYAEIKKRVKNKDMRELFGFMSRDEGRHAGFINHTLNDFDVGVDLSFLTKAKKYTYFEPKFIYYATYLSEKIGYARYIHIYHNFAQRNPDKRFHPIFQWFENWCWDEFRHGEAFAVLMRSQPHTLEGRNKLWIKFFLLAVFATMYVRDHARRPFFQEMGWDVDEFDRRVITMTNDISKQVFPVVIDTANEKVWQLFERMHQNNEAARAYRKAGGFLNGLKAKLRMLDNGITFAKLYMVPGKANPLKAEFRMTPEQWLPNLTPSAA